MRVRPQGADQLSRTGEGLLTATMKLGAQMLHGVVERNSKVSRPEPSRRPTHAGHRSVASKVGSMPGRLAVRWERVDLDRPPQVGHGEIEPESTDAGYGEPMLANQPADTYRSQRLAHDELRVRLGWPARHTIVKQIEHASRPLPPGRLPREHDTPKVIGSVIAIVHRLLQYRAQRQVADVKPRNVGGGPEAGHHDNAVVSLDTISVIDGQRSMRNNPRSGARLRVRQHHNMGALVWWELPKRPDPSRGRTRDDRCRVGGADRSAPSEFGQWDRRHSIHAMEFAHEMALPSEPNDLMTSEAEVTQLSGRGNAVRTLEVLERCCGEVGHVRLPKVDFAGGSRRPHHIEAATPVVGERSSAVHGQRLTSERQIGCR